MPPESDDDPILELSCRTRDPNLKKIFDCMVRCLTDEQRRLLRQGKIVIYPGEHDDAQ